LGFIGFFKDFVGIYEIFLGFIGQAYKIFLSDLPIGKTGFHLSNFKRKCTQYVYVSIFRKTFRFDNICLKLF